LQRVLTQRAIEVTGLSSSFCKMLVLRIDAAFAIAATHGHQDVIFGTWGCEHGESFTRMWFINCFLFLL